jgi:hypothetical protein
VAGVVHEDVEVAGLLDQPPSLLGVGDVGLDCAAARFLRDRLRLVRTGAVADDYLRPAAGQLERDRPSDSTRPSGDERRLAFQRAELRQS